MSTIPPPEPSTCYTNPSTFQLKPAVSLHWNYEPIPRKTGQRSNEERHRIVVGLERGTLLPHYGDKVPGSSTYVSIKMIDLCSDLSETLDSTCPPDGTSYDNSKARSALIDMTLWSVVRDRNFDECYPSLRFEPDTDIFGNGGVDGLMAMAAGRREDRVTRALDASMMLEGEGESENGRASARDD